MTTECGSLLDCRCSGPFSNVNVDGNGGHAPDCPANPKRLPRNLTHCDGCDLPFSIWITPEQALRDFGSVDTASYVCSGCGGWTEGDYEDGAPIGNEGWA